MRSHGDAGREEARGQRAVTANNVLRQASAVTFPVWLASLFSTVPLEAAGAGFENPPPVSGRGMRCLR